MRVKLKNLVREEKNRRMAHGYTDIKNCYELIVLLYRTYGIHIHTE